MGFDKDQIEAAFCECKSLRQCVEWICTREASPAAEAPNSPVVADSEQLEPDDGVQPQAVNPAQGVSRPSPQRTTPKAAESVSKPEEAEVRAVKAALNTNSLWAVMSQRFNENVSALKRRQAGRSLQGRPLHVSEGRASLASRRGSLARSLTRSISDASEPEQPRSDVGRGRPSLVSRRRSSRQSLSNASEREQPAVATKRGRSSSGRIEQLAGGSRRSSRTNAGLSNPAMDSSLLRPQPSQDETGDIASPPPQPMPTPRAGRQSKRRREEGMQDVGNRRQSSGTLCKEVLLGAGWDRKDVDKIVQEGAVGRRIGIRQAVAQAPTPATKAITPDARRLLANAVPPVNSRCQGQPQKRLRSK